MNAEQIANRQTEVQADLARLTEARTGAATALEALTPKLETATEALGRAGLDHRLGTGSADDVAKASRAVAELERERSGHHATLAEADRRLADLRAEGAALDRQHRHLAHQDVTRQRDRARQVVDAIAADLGPKIAELLRLELATVQAAQEAGVGTLRQSMAYDATIRRLVDALHLHDFTAAYRRDRASFDVADDAEREETAA